MDRNIKIALAALAVILIIAAVVTGFVLLRGPETGQANTLVGQTSDILATVTPQVNQADQLLGQAFTQLSTSQTEAEKASLSQARALIVQIIPQLQTAKDNIDQAAGLDISLSFRDYLQAESRSLGFAIDLAHTRQQIADLLLADPTLAQPDSQQTLAQLKQTAADQSTQAQQAEDQANTIADEHPDEIR